MENKLIIFSENDSSFSLNRSLMLLTINNLMNSHDAADGKERK